MQMPGRHSSPHGDGSNRPRAAVVGVSPVLRAKATGPNPVYDVLGETDAGRRLVCVVMEFPDGRGDPVTTYPVVNQPTLVEAANNRGVADRLVLILGRRDR